MERKRGRGVPQEARGGEEIHTNIKHTNAEVHGLELSLAVLIQ